MVGTMNNFIKTIILLASLVPIVGTAADEVKEVDLSLLKDRGMLMRVITDGRPVWIAYRTLEAIEIMEEQYHIHYQEDPEGVNKNYRSFNKDYFIVFGGCPEGDQLPYYYPKQGFVCASDCAKFDMAGRPSNQCAGGKPMDIPDHYYKSEKTVVIPIHQDGSLNNERHPTREKHARVL